jgi:uncharacterized coiled-coil protein SlyX
MPHPGDDGEELDTDGELETGSELNFAPHVGELRHELHETREELARTQDELAGLREAMESMQEQVSAPDDGDDEELEVGREP